MSGPEMHALGKKISEELERDHKLKKAELEFLADEIGRRLGRLFGG